MFNIDTYDFSKKDFDNWEIRNNYHCVYILENGKDAYIGETTDIIGRAKKHNRDEKEREYKFQNMHVITSEKAEATPARHYEKLLIKLMRVDNKFNVLNEQDGFKYTEYARKNQFELYFDKLWFLLEEKGLVKTKNFQSLLNSQVYKYSPFTDLNNEQRKTVTTIINVLNSDETLDPDDRDKSRPILIEGRAGTGKTLVAIYLLYYLINNEMYKDKSIAIIVPNPSLREEIKFICKNTGGLNIGVVYSPIELSKKYYDIIICDEAHKLRRRTNLFTYSYLFDQANKRLGNDNSGTELDWLLQNSKYQVLFYDKRQIVSPKEIQSKQFDDIIKKYHQEIRPIVLKKQMRVQGGESYVKYIYDILYEKNPKKRKIKNYDLKIVSKYSDLRKIIQEKDKEYGLCRRASGYGYPFIDDGTEHAYDIYIGDTVDKWNSCTKGWIRKHYSENEVGSIYTLCGIDLNYAGVVIGPELYFDKSENKVKVNKEKFYDKAVKYQTSDEKLKEYILNSYGILLTRGIKGTYIYIEDEGLAEYFKQFIDEEECNIYSYN